ncbi:hypothetical protein GH714_019001 [Hevea brasiliensis]|uniref:Uncharacterized protein n=1 Tax=Hevea brasiliensis TaxID=3981 RepID=A0A6A6LYI3_HEVBR|nr:hypothetical protein GH714_019001 [Hevea brasiliensis]
MASRKQKKAARYDKLRDVPISTAMSKTSIIVYASKYIEELKEKVERLNQDIGTSQASATSQNQLPMYQGDADSLDAQVVKQAVVQAINNWRESNDQD